MTYTVNVAYDHTNHHYYTLSSDIPGLWIETETYEGYVEVARDAAPDLVGDGAAGSKIRFILEREVSLTA